MSTGSESKRWDPAEHPRVPAGHGRASGRFMSTVDSILKLLGERPEAYDQSPSVISVQNPDPALQPGIFRGFQRSGDWVEVGLGDLGTERGRVVAVGPTVVSLRQEPNAAWPQGMPIDVHYDAITSIRQAPHPQTPDRTRLYRPDLGSKPGPTFPSALGHDIMLQTRGGSMVRGTLVSTSDTSVTLQSWNGSHTQQFGQVVPYDQITEGWDLGWPPAHGAPEVGDTVTLYGISDARYRVIDINDVGTYRLQEIGSDNTVLAHPDNVTLAERGSGSAMDVLNAGRRVLDDRRRWDPSVDTLHDLVGAHVEIQARGLQPIPGRVENVNSAAVYFRMDRNGEVLTIPRGDIESVRRLSDDETINADYFAAHNLLDRRVEIVMRDGGAFDGTVTGTAPDTMSLSTPNDTYVLRYDEIESVGLFPRWAPSQRAASELTALDHDELKKKPIKKNVLREKAAGFAPGFNNLSEEEQAVLVHAFEVSIPDGLSTRITSASKDGGEYRVNGKVYDRYGNPVGTFNREIYPLQSPPTMHNAYFSIDSRYQGQGLADAFYDQSESVLLDQGVEEITINADISVGGYAWARRGFDWEDRSDASYMAQRMRDWLRSNLDPGIHIIQGADEFIERLEQGRVHPWELAAFGEDDPALHWTRRTTSGVEIDMWPGKAIMLGTSWNGVKPVGWSPPSTKGLAQTDYYRGIAALYPRADELFVPGDHLDGAPEDNDYNLHLADLLFTYSPVETKDAHFEELHPRNPHTGEFVHRGNLVPPLRDMLPLDIPLPEGYIPPTPEDRRRVRDATVVPGMAESIYERLEQMLDRALDDPDQTPEGMSIDDAYDEPPSPEEAIAKGDWVYFGACRDIRREADGLLGFTQESITTDPGVIYEPDPGWGGARTGANDPQRDALVLLYALKNTPRLEQPLFRGVTDPPQEMLDSLKRGSTFDLPLAAFTDGEAEATRFGSDLMFKIEGPTHAITGGMMGEGTFEYITGGRFKVVGIRHEKTWMGYTLQALKDRIAAMDEEGYDVTDYSDDYIDWMWKNDEFDDVFIQRINQTEVRESIPRWGQATIVRIEQVGVFDPDTALLRKDVTGGVPRWRWSYLFDTALSKPKPRTRREKKAFDRMAALKGELAAEMDAEINRLTDILEEILSQQEETVIARLTGVKARKGTRHWDPVPPPTETKVLDVAYILLLAKWISMIRKAVRGSLGKTFNTAMLSVAKRAGTNPVRISAQEIAARIDPFTERLVDSMTARFHKIQEVIAISEGQGQDIGTIATNVRGAYKNKRRWAEMASEQATVGVYNMGSLVQADRSGEVAAKAWLCLLGDVKVSALDVTHAARRWYEGQVVGVRTTNGRRVTMTPQHEVLTASGWVEAQFLQPGDQVVSVGGAQSVGTPQIEDDVPLFGDLVDAALERGHGEGSSTCTRTVVRRVHLDGNTIVDEKVEVVGADRDLLLNVEPNSSETFGDLAFMTADALAALVEVGTTPWAPGALEGSFAGSLAEDIATLSGRADASGLALASQRRAGFDQEARDRWTAGTVGAGQHEDRRTGQVVLDEIVDVEVRAFSGHVYDLSTESHWFTADSLVVHNSMRDDRVRHSHRIADGQVRALRDPFIVGGYPMMYPGDPTGPARERFGCRCTLIYRLARVSGNAVPGPFRGLPLIPLPTDALGWPETIPAPWPSSKAFNPDQPRIPKGSEHAGRWVRIRPADAFANLWTRVLAAAGRPTRANPEGFKVGDSFDPFLAITKLQKLPVGAKVKAGGKEWTHLHSGEWIDDSGGRPITGVGVTQQARDAGTRVEIVALSEWDDWVGHVLDHDARSEEWSGTIWALNNLPPGSVITAVNEEGGAEFGGAHEQFLFTRLPNGDWETTSGDMVGPVLPTHALIQRAQITQGHYVVTKIGDLKPSDYEIEEALRDEGNRRAAKRLVAQRIAERLSDVDPMELARAAGILDTDWEQVQFALTSPPPRDYGFEGRVRLDEKGNLVRGWYDPKSGRMNGLGNITDSQGNDLSDPENWMMPGTPEADDLVRRAAVRHLIDSWARSSNDDNPLGLALQEAAAEEFKITGAMDWGYRKQWVITSSDGRTMKFNSPDDAKEFRDEEATWVPDVFPAVGDTIAVHLAGRDVTGTVTDVSGPLFVEYSFDRQGVPDHGAASVDPNELLAINGRSPKWKRVSPWSEPEEMISDDLSPNTRDRTERIMDESGPVLRSFLRAQYDSTQDWLKEQGIDEIDLYRGMGKGPRTQRGDRAQGAGITPARMRPMSSWTTSSREAQNFGNATYFTRVPREQVLGTPASGFGCLKETEIVILGHPMDVAFEAFQGTSARPDELPDLFDRKVVERRMQMFDTEAEAANYLDEVQAAEPADLDMFIRQVAGMWEVYQLIKPVEVKGFNPRLHPRDQDGRFTDVPIPKVGLTFTHARHLDTDWKPGPGQRYVDAPHRVYRVSRVTSTQVYFTGLDGRGHFSVDRDRWGEVYGGPASTPDVALIQTRSPGEKAVPDTSGVKVVSSTKIADALVEVKDFDPDQPRDWHGRWVRIAGLLRSVTPGKAPLNLHRTATPPTWPDGTQYSRLPKALRDRMDRKVKDALGVDLAEMTRNVTEAYHAASRDDHDQGVQWYENALADCHETQQRLHGVSLQTVVAAYANMSPQTPWENNVVWADHVLTRWSQNPTIDDAFMSRTRSMDDVRAGGTTPHRRTKRTETLSWWLAHEISLIDKKIAKQDEGSARDRLQERRDRLQDVLDGPPRHLSEYPVDVQATLLRLDGQSGKGMRAVRLSDNQDISANYTMDSNIENTLTLLYGPNGDGSGNDTRDWISAALADGHKVRSFYNDILTGGASTAVTIDTHALDVAVLGRTATRGGAHLTDAQRKVLKTLTSKGEEKYPGLGDLGVEGAYAEIAEAFRRATDVINSERAKQGQPPLTAAQVQAVVWITGMKQKKGAA